MSIILALIGMPASLIILARVSRLPLARWVLVPIVTWASLFLWSGTISAIISYYVFGVSQETINAGEGLFVVIFFVFCVPVLALHIVVAWLNWW